MIAATAAAITAAIVAHSVLSSSSGTHFALMAFLPLLVAPGLAPWLWPRPRTFAFWAVFGGGASVIWAIAGSPYSYERELPGWRAVQLTAWLAIGIVVAGKRVPRSGSRARVVTGRARDAARSAAPPDRPARACRSRP